MKTLEPTHTSRVTGKLQTTIPARLARACGIRTGMSLEWVASGGGMISARIAADPLTKLREVHRLAAKNPKASVKLAADFEKERAWQRSHAPKV